MRRLRAELAATTDRTRQARLLTEIADLEERSGDEPAAARDYLAAYNADAFGWYSGSALMDCLQCFLIRFAYRRVI